MANEKFNKLNLTLDNSDPERTLINYTSRLTYEKGIARAKIVFVLRASLDSSKGEKLFKCGRELSKTNIDVCKMAKMQSSTFAKLLMENFAPSANFQISCPLTPRTYTLTNFT
ncbi:CLUMA_CG015947, isoform A [Clunio marinus]|uniref:CLUMA_CG015947, isoform A n=1 Tax=Clunio marinus TaxID=568069 RepID=A0A1J1ISY1_9DIPT|nr:CLUMA_CG015947, isoform A [Clunio marinus]